MTNGDVVRQMTNSDLQELWSITRFDDKYVPECQHEEGSCKYWDFSCEGCPLTFRNWLDDEVDR